MFCFGERCVRTLEMNKDLPKVTMSESGNIIFRKVWNICNKNIHFMNKIVDDLSI